jgi:hypothetical protein
LRRIIGLRNQFSGLLDDPSSGLRSIKTVCCIPGDMGRRHDGFMGLELLRQQLGHLIRLVRRKSKQNVREIVGSLLGKMARKSSLGRFNEQRLRDSKIHGSSVRVRNQRLIASFGLLHFVQ